MDSPRGRIFLMKEVLEGQMSAADALPFIDRCLGCMACVTACPSGVEYGDLLAPFRARPEQARRRPPLDRTVRTLVKETLPYPDPVSYTHLDVYKRQPIAGSNVRRRRRPTNRTR